MTHADTADALRITVTDTATVFSGAANLHRFDAPSARDIAAYIRHVFGPHPGGAEVHLAASPERCREIEAALKGYDVSLTFADPGDFREAVRADEGLPRAADTLGLHRPTDAVEEDRRALWIIGIAVTVVAVACAIAVVVTARSLFGAREVAEAAGETPTVVATTATTTAPVETLTGVTRTSISEKPPATVVHERDGVRVELPAGFTLEREGDMWRASGPVPDFRLHIAVDDLFTLPPETMAEHVRREVEADPQTEMVATDGFALTYLERPGDGSEVLWKTWPHGTHQIFLACQTRGVPTRVQQATCEMAMRSAEYAPLAGDLAAQ
ncbi:type VII secretion-associated protein [Corynebacterium aquatimens]|uniref:type VII secretion-associated protein n=1 Tax=Corynebacterium TaxID=1716 RepID=UPI001F2BB2F4|nr:MULTISPECIES: type VII secretion-associated protein [Corynebacterium]QYH20229.1 type VII secretion-associated protein [Corynebacterium aquatimens]UIZ92506.1 type VII secretion-associated protein [Corynebacterium sp. CNCTC7651]